MARLYLTRFLPSINRYALSPACTVTAASRSLKKLNTRKSVSVNLDF